MVISAILNLIGDTLGEAKKEDELGDPVEFNPAFSLDVGILWVQFFKKLLIPSYARYDEIKNRRICPTRCKLTRFEKPKSKCQDYVKAAKCTCTCTCCNCCNKKQKS